MDWSPVFSSLNVNYAWHHMKSILKGIFERHAPTIMKKVRGKPAPWLNNDVKSLMNARDKLLRKSRRTKANSESSQYKSKRNEVNAAVRKAKSTYYKNLLNENSTDANKFWKTLKSIYPTKNRDKTSLRSFDIGGEKTTDPSQIANAFCTFFTQVIASLKSKAIPLRNFAWKNPSPMQMRTNSKFSFRKVSQLEVMKQLKSIKRSKSTGIDDLPPNMLKDAAPAISAPLTYLINQSLETGLFPTAWKAAKIIPIHKSGSYSNLDNYRPISILPVLSKVIEKVIHRQLLTFLEESKLLSKFQFGFRPKLSTELATTLLLDDIRRSVDEGKLVGVVFVDLTKAFDTISHSKLLDKLPRYGIGGNELEWFKDDLFNRSAVVSYDGRLSKSKEILTGVPQGSTIGPLLFIIFFNDITDVLENSKIIKYADDTVLYVDDKEVNTIQAKLNKDIDAVADWLDENELIINLKKGKTESLLFGTAKKLANLNDSFAVCYRGETISETKEYKYLGMEMNSSLNLNSHFEKNFKRASGGLRLLAKLRGCLNLKTAKAIYQSMILPTLTYCGILQLKLSPTQLNRLSSFHDRAVKIVSTGNSIPTELSSVIQCNRKRACEIVRKCLVKDISSLFHDYFTIINHEKRTRNNDCLLRLPKIRTEYARKSFFFMGAKVYNDLPAEIRKTENQQNFIELLEDHF